MTVEGRYGRFDFHGEYPRQTWIGAGIGIAPFIARLQAGADEGGQAPVDLIYLTTVPSEAFIENIRQLADKAARRADDHDRLVLDRLEPH